MTDDYPSIYHPDIGEYIEIRNELAFKTARVVWDDIAAKYEPVTIPVVVLEQKDPVQVKPALITDARDLSLAKSVIPSDELNPKGDAHKHPAKRENDMRKLNSGNRGRRTGHSKWKIPFDFHTDRGNYDRAYRICRLYNLPYVDAVKKQEEDKANGVSHKKTARKGTGKIVACPYCSYTCNSHGLHLHVLHHHKDKYQEFKNNPDAYKTTTPQPQNEPDSTKIVLKKPENSPNNSLSKPLEIVTGLHVKQIRPDNGRQFFGTGTVVARERDGAIIHVRNGGGKIHKIDATCLEVVTSPAEKKAEA